MFTLSVFLYKCDQVSDEHGESVQQDITNIEIRHRGIETRQCWLTAVLSFNNSKRLIPETIFEVKFLLFPCNIIYTRTVYRTVYTLT